MVGYGLFFLVRIQVRDFLDGQGSIPDPSPVLHRESDPDLGQRQPDPQL